MSDRSLITKLPRFTLCLLACFAVACADGDADATNELIESAELEGTVLTLTEPDNKVTVDLASLGGDSDPTNELQTLGLQAGMLSISDGNEVSLVGLIMNSRLWTESGGDIHYDSGAVGIGTTTPGSGATFSDFDNILFDLDGQMVISGNGNGESMVFRNSGFAFGDGQNWFRLSVDNSRIFEVTNTTDFFFDNVDVYPDDDTQQLGRSDKRWSDVWANRGDFSGDVMAASHMTPSDSRYKTDLQELEHSVSRLQQIRGLSYRYRAAEFPNKGFSDRRRLGVSAQEVEAVFPELVVTDAQGYKAVDYPGLTPVMIEAIKEQQATIEIQQAQLSRQQEHIESLLQASRALAARIDRLEQP